jgi:hypothetical protein
LLIETIRVASRRCAWAMMMTVRQQRFLDLR